MTSRGEDWLECSARLFTGARDFPRVGGMDSFFLRNLKIVLAWQLRTSARVAQCCRYTHEHGIENDITTTY